MFTCKGFCDWAMNRLGENSTWRGFVAMLMAAGIQLAPDLQAAIITAGFSVIGLINILRKKG